MNFDLEVCDCFSECFQFSSIFVCQISSDNTSCSTLIYERIKAGRLSFEAYKKPTMICFGTILFLFLALIIVRDAVVVFDTRKTEAFIILI